MARPELKSYFTSRGACMGQVPGEVIAAAFGVFNAKAVVPAVAGGWQITSREAILAARERGAMAMLQRVLGDQPDGLDRVTGLLRRAAAAAPWAGRPIFGGLRSLGFPSHPLGEMWRAGDLLREHRGDSHVSCCRLTGGSSCRFPCLLPSEAMASGKGREAGS